MKSYKDSWKIGEIAWFEYHCERSHTSTDAILWYHDHQQVRIITIEASDASDDLDTLKKRCEACALNSYGIQFNDGLQHVAIEDELFTDPKFFDLTLSPPNLHERQVG